MMDNSSIPFDERLLAAYLSTTYRVWVEREKFWDILIGALHPAVDHYLNQHRLSTWVFITAWNPRSKWLDILENQARNQGLLAMIQQSRLLYFEGVGIGASGEWPAEVSYWVAGVNREQALEWGKFWEQNAVVWGEINQTAELYWMI